MQAPAIYRLFGDKDRLLEAVAVHVYATFLAAKQVDPNPAEPIDSANPIHPVEDLRAGWDLAVEFGLANPAPYTWMYSEPGLGTTSDAFRASLQILQARIRRLAAGGWLRVDESLAAAVIHATTRGAVLTWLSLPEDQRDQSLLLTLREAMVAAVTTETSVVHEAGPDLDAALRT